MFLLKLLDQCLEELLLSLHLLNLGLHLKCDPLLHASLILSVATHLSKEFHVPHGAEEKTTLVELLTEGL